MTKNKLEIERLQALLKGRQEEYAVFGCTSEDREQDKKIKEEIIKLKNDNAN